MATNCILSRAAAMNGCLVSGLNKAKGVRPIMCHPPGLDTGYTPVWLPPMATDQAATLLAGVVFLGQFNCGFKPPK